MQSRGGAPDSLPRDPSLGATTYPPLHHLYRTSALLSELEHTLRATAPPIRTPLSVLCLSSWAMSCQGAGCLTRTGPTPYSYSHPASTSCGGQFGQLLRAREWDSATRPLADTPLPARGMASVVIRILSLPIRRQRRSSLGERRGDLGLPQPGGHLGEAPPFDITSTYRGPPPRNNSDWLDREPRSQTALAFSPRLCVSLSPRPASGRGADQPKTSTRLPLSLSVPWLTTTHLQRHTLCPKPNLTLSRLGADIPKPYLTPSRLGADVPNPRLHPYLPSAHT